MKGVVAFAVAMALGALPFAEGLAQQTPPQSQQTQSPSSPAGTSGQGQLTIASDSLLGTKVRDAQGKDIGEVSKLMIDATEGKVMSVIIQQGGTLGMGAKEVSVPWDALKLQRGQDQQLVVTLQQEMLQPTPQVQEQQRRQQQEGQTPAASPPTGSQEQPQQPRQQRQ